MPGPDGTNVEFFKFLWDDIENSLFIFIQQFFSTTCMHTAWGKTFVSLIPKTVHPKKVLDFCPISLCNVSYKVVTKILANLLKPILDGLIGREQSGFIVGRTLLDDIIDVQEMVHYINQNQKTPIGC